MSSCVSMRPSRHPSNGPITRWPFLRLSAGDMGVTSGNRLYWKGAEVERVRLARRWRRHQLDAVLAGLSAERVDRGEEFVSRRLERREWRHAGDEIDVLRQ